MITDKLNRKLACEWLKGYVYGGFTIGGIAFLLWWWVK